MTILEDFLNLTLRSLNQQAVKYLKSRGIKKATAELWEIGYLADDKDILQLDSNLDDLYQKGILLRRVEKSPLDQYITFPMRDQYSTVIGFSGRPPLSNEEVKTRNLKKYWHSRFDKRKFLFGLDKAVDAIREQGYVLVVEGQFDVITVSQAGIKNIVSTCGTALTEEQIILLSRYADTICVVFDNDEAGQKALTQLTKHQRNDLKFIPIVLPDLKDEEGNLIKQDPDSFVRKLGIRAFEQEIKKQTELA